MQYFLIENLTYIFWKWGNAPVLEILNFTCRIICQLYGIFVSEETNNLEPLHSLSRYLKAMEFSDVFNFQEIILFVRKNSKHFRLTFIIIIIISEVPFLIFGSNFFDFC